MNTKILAKIVKKRKLMSQNEQICKKIQKLQGEKKINLKILQKTKMALNNKNFASQNQRLKDIKAMCQNIMNCHF